MMFALCNGAMDGRSLNMSDLLQLPKVLLLFVVWTWVFSFSSSGSSISLFFENLWSLLIEIWLLVLAKEVSVSSFVVVVFCGKLKGKCVNINHAKFGELNAFFNDRAFIAFICNVQEISANEKKIKSFQTISLLVN